MLRGRDLRNQGGETVYLRLRDGGQEGAGGVRPVGWTGWDLQDKYSWIHQLPAILHGQLFTVYQTHVY